VWGETSHRNTFRYYVCEVKEINVSDMSNIILSDGMFEKLKYVLIRDE